MKKGILGAVKNFLQTIIFVIAIMGVIAAISKPHVTGTIDKRIDVKQKNIKLEQKVMKRDLVFIKLLLMEKESQELIDKVEKKTEILLNEEE